MNTRELLPAALRAVLDAVADGVVVLDRLGQPIYSNGPAKAILGLDIRGMDPAEWSAYYGCYGKDGVTPFPSHDLPAARALRGESVTAEEIFIRNARKPDGLWIVVDARPLLDEEGRLDGAAAIFRDRTFQRAAEASPCDAVERFQLCIQCVRDYAVFMLDTLGRVKSWNPGAQHMSGYHMDEILGKHFSCFYPEEDARSGKPERLLRLAAAQGHVEDEGWRVRRNGTRFWADAVITALKDEAGNLRGYAKVTRDATERRAAKLALLQKSEELKRSNDELSLFAYTASHELQEPLRKINAFADLLKEKTGEITDAGALDLLLRMQDAARRMQRLVDDILELSRTTTNTRLLEPVALAAVLREIAADFEARLQAAGATMEIGLLPTVRADGEQLRQIFRNLVSNAYKFRKKEEPLRISVTSRNAGDGFVHISVQDNGIGFEQQYAERIFKPFQRLHRRGEYEGTGMGLAICERILLRHGGKISARSEPGKGSTFVVTLPGPVQS